eukprot:3459002-Pleurochrysis_carterae.AAC.1
MIQAHLDKEDEEGLLVFLDLEKAFDRCSWNYLRTALRKLRFHKNYCKWIDLLYDDNNCPKRRIIANGHLSEPFRITQGTAQGCPLSPLLFLVIVEGFTRSVQQDTRIQGIKIGEMHSKIRHFADDTIGTLRNENELEYFQEHIHTFCAATNMLENQSKRDILPLGKTSKSDLTSRLTPLAINPDYGDAYTPNWVERNNTLISLGIPIGNTTNMNAFLKAKYKGAKTALAKAHSIASISLIGRTRILNANYYGKLRYYFWTLQFPPWLVKAMETDATHFIWKSKPSLDTEAIGTVGGNGKYISRHATYRTTKKGGAGQLHLPSHIKAIQASWIIRYLHPRVAQWKQILDKWINMPRYAILHLSASEQNTLLRGIPPGHHLITQALKAFWELKLQLSDQHIKDKGTADLVRAIPLAHNNFFKINKSTAQKLAAVGMIRIDDLYAENNKSYTWKQFRDIISNKHNLAPTQIRSIISLIQNTQKRIPNWLLKILKRKRSWDQPFLCGWRDSDDAPIYGLADNDKLYEFHVNQSGIGTIVSTPHDLREWNCEEHLQKITVWGTTKDYFNPPPIIGYSYNTYPQDEGWVIRDSTECIRLSSLSVHRLTHIFTPESKPPNCEEAWNTRLSLNGISINWAEVWSSVGSFLTTPTDEKVWFKLVHRGLMVNGKESINKNCRLCNYSNESQLHLMHCPALYMIKQYVALLLQAMGLNTSLIHPELTWLLGMTKTGQLLDPAHHAIIRIHWRHVYAAMVRLQYDGEAFSQARVKSDIARTFLSRILAYQYEKRLCFYRRRHSHAGNYRLPKSAAQQVKSLGDLRLSDGTLLVKADVIAVIEQQGISCAQLVPDLLSSSSSTSQRAPSSSSSGRRNNYSNNKQRQQGSITCNNSNNVISISNPQHIAATSTDVIAARIADQQTRQPRRFMPFQGNG